jgi:protoheme IX farnesyltransferase
LEYKAQTITAPNSFIRQKLADYNQLIKTRLTMLVVFSAGITYLMAAKNQPIDWEQFMFLIIGGFLVVSASNGINQVIERNFDKLMIRTANRPVATGRMQISEAVIASLLFGVAGIFMMGRYLNEITGWLSFISLFAYAFVYTPLKRISPISVFVGAFPGALPPLLGWTAYTGNISYEAILLFAVQFFWQFPHFWSIAWILDDDYKRAGFKMLPSNKKDKSAALQTLVFSLMLIPVGFMPSFEGITGLTSGIIAIAGGVALSYFAFRLYITCDNKDAKRLMFASFLYLPLVQIAYWLDKI